ncbi:T9SS sorting signal type C domain-containing protein [Flavobacterium sp. LPB0248]|uniref:T9SS sorting signal type C domain-containing protein n=1 Tax=Flavobacterium sp. LPB0248 TaxID=2614441 RepID=UPI0015A65355|nr:T9SS sorting signal type C domain-containing protein [Flavobacterium sp. LPB0248]QLC67037.1 T9SS sorting signal type C domain-containing protein [Flavobacterium sp. LPB0248]
MKKDLLIVLSFFSFSTLVTYIRKTLEFSWKFKIIWVVVLSFFYTTSEAQTLAHPLTTSNPSFPLPAGMDEVTVEAWGAGGAGGAAKVTPLIGRSGGGGGGGAYAKGTIVTTGVSNLNVVVAPTTAGGTANGALGGASFITGFTSFFNAPGGQGGNANIATNSTPTGGTGGTGAIGNLATASGANGTNGSSAALSALLSTGGGGNGANFGSGGGSGGAVQTSVILTDLPGTNGGTNGGGGGGAMSSNTLQNGGSGARGYVNITYTCKPYSFTGISAPNVCTTTGTTSQVQLTGTPATLPAGTYTVTYNRSSPAFTGLTATMTVITPGSGSFTAVGLNVLGTSTITVTSLTSVDCTSTISTNNFVNVIVGAQPTLTLSATPAVCVSSNLQSTTLPYSGATNSPSTYSITWNASPTNSFLPVSNVALTASPINIQVPANTVAGTYTGNLTVANTAGCISPVYSFTVTVNPLPAITLGSIAGVCTSAAVQNVTLPYTAPANSPTTYSITWNASPTNNFLAVTDVSLSSSPISIAVPAGTAAGTYTGTLTVKNANGCVSTPSNFTVTVSPLPAITLGIASSVCFNAAAQTSNLSYSAPANSPASYSIVWNASPANSFLAVTDASLTASPISIAVPAGTAAGTYTGTLTVKNANGCISAPSNFTVTVNPLPAITLGTASSVCFNAAAQTSNLSYSAPANSPTSYSIVWNASPTNNFLAVTDASLSSSPISIAVPAGTAAGTYTGTLTVKNANGCISTPSNFTVTVNPLPAITLGTASAVCFNASAQTSNLSYSAPANSPASYSIVWNASPTNNFLAVTDASLSSSPISIAVPAGTAAGTYTGTLTVKNANGCISTPSNFTVTVNPLPAITLGTASSVCFNASAQTSNLSYSAPANSPASYSIVWNASPANNFLAVADASLTASPISIAVPAGTAAGTYTGTLTVKNANGCVSTPSNFTVTVNPLPAITLGTASAVCFNAAAQTSNLSYSAPANSPTTYSITWNASPTNNFLAVADASLTASPISIAVPAGTAAGTYTGTLTVKNANGCISAPSNFTVTVNPLPAITLGTASSVCFNTAAQTSNLSYSAPANSPASYSIVWNASPANSFLAVTDASLSSSPISIAVPAGTAAGTYTGTLTVKNANGCVSTPSNFTVIVNSSPTITTSGVFTPVCQSSLAQTTTLNYNSTTGSPTNYAIDWVVLTDQGTTPFPFSSGSGEIVNINVPANTVAGTYNGVMIITTSNGCSVSQAVSLTVNPVVTAPTASVTQLPTCVNNTGVITVTSPASGTGYTYSIDGVDFSNTSGVFTGLSSGGYNVQVKNSTSGCESQPTLVTINAFVTKAWNGSVDANWGNPANWTPTGVPIATDCIDIPDVGIDPIISGTNGSFFASRLTIENNGSLIVQSTNTITVTNEVNVLGNGVFVFENNSSLVQVSDVTNSGNITYKRNTTPVRRYDVTYWSSPVTRDPAFTLHDLSPNTLWDKFHRYDSSVGWIVIENGAGEMVKGNAYSIRAPQPYDLNNAQIFGGEFVGVPNNGTISGPAAVAGKLVFLGNPYPSAIYADQFIHDNADRLYGTLYFWTHNSLPTLIPGSNTFTYSSTDFAYYNLSGQVDVGQMEGTGASSPGNQVPPAGYIASGQGFFAKSLTGQSVVYTNSMRVPSLNSQFFKSKAATDEEKHRVWLNLTNTQGAFKQLLIGYITGATNSWDNSYDATTMNANPFLDFYSINEGKKLVIQGRAVPFVVSDTIPLGYKSTIPEGNFTMSIDHTDGNLSTQDIYLQDNVTKTIHNLKTGSYTFTSAPGTFLNRFVLRYTNKDDKPLGNEEFDNENQQILVSVKDKNIKLQSISEQDNLQEAAIYDTGGTLLYLKKQIGNKEWLITNFQSGPQVLFVKMTLDSGKIVTRKIVFQ